MCYGISMYQAKAKNQDTIISPIFKIKIEYEIHALRLKIRIIC